MGDISFVDGERGFVSWSSVGEGVERVVLGGVDMGFGGLDIIDECLMDGSLMMMWCLDCVIAER